MRRDDPNRHGRAADALIASYVRELLADDEAEPVRGAAELAAEAQPAARVRPADGLAADAVL